MNKNISTTLQEATLEDLTPTQRRALGERLLALADDQLVLAHRNSEWIGHGPILEEDIALANIAQDELGHAQLYYNLLSELDGSDPDQLVFFRDASQYRSAVMLELPKGDWAFTMLRQYLFDTFEAILTDTLITSRLKPLADIAQNERKEELFHLRHTHLWMQRLATGTAESKRRTQAALDTLWPHAQQLFEPLASDAVLVEVGLFPDLHVLRVRWLSSVTAALSEAGLSLDANATAPTSSREQYSDHLTAMLKEMQEVARANADAVVW